MDSRLNEMIEELENGVDWFSRGAMVGIGFAGIAFTAIVLGHAVRGLVLS